MFPLVGQKALPSAVLGAGEEPALQASARALQVPFAPSADGGAPGASASPTRTGIGAVFGRLRVSVSSVVLAAGIGFICLTGSPAHAQASDDTSKAAVAGAVVAVRKASKDGRLGVRILSQRPLTYAGGADAATDRPAHVRAASGVVPFGDRLAVVQDDAHFIALVDPRTGLAEAVVLPAGSDGKRVFDDGRKNKKLKFDYEAAAVVSTEQGPLLIGMGSGSLAPRESVVLMRPGPAGPEAKVYPAARLYAALRELKAFSGSELNVEALSDLGGGRLRVFNRGNGAAKDGLQPLNASLDLSLAELLRFLEAPATAPLPAFSAVTQYQLGDLGGVRLTFSDATRSGRQVLFLAASEDSPDATHDGVVAGSVLGTIDPDGTVRWAQIMDAEGKPVTAKPEGLCVDPAHPDRVWLVTDPDDPLRPAELLQVELTGPWAREGK